MRCRGAVALVAAAAAAASASAAAPVAPAPAPSPDLDARRLQPRAGSRLQALLDGSLVLVADVSEAATDDVVEDWAAAPAPAAAWTGSDVPFITVRGTQLMAGQSPFYYVGANVPMAAALASRGAGGDRRRLEAELDALVALGITHVRVLGASEGPDSEPWRIVPSLQPCPGVFDADALDGLHYAVYALGRRKLRATVALGNEWPWSGGFAQYVAWARRLRAGATPDVLCEEGRSRTGDLHNATWRARGFQRLPYPGPGGHAWEAWQDYAGAFYADGLAQSLWRRAVERIVHTVNKYTGVSLAADPTVAIWQLGNEPRAPQGARTAPPARFHEWLADASAFVKSLCPSQLVSSGMEGDTALFSRDQSELLTSNVFTLDVVTAHVWPMNFGWYSPHPDPAADGALARVAILRAQQYVRAAVAQAAFLGRPLVMEEYGFPRDGGSFSPAASTANRDAMYAMMNDELLASAATAGALAGVNFWAWAGSARPVGFESVPATGICTQPAQQPPALSLNGQATQWANCFSVEALRPSACPAFTWWAADGVLNAAAAQHGWLGDPPHEPQGWYSIYDTDATTLAVVANASAALRQLLTCARAAVGTSLLAGREPDLAGLLASTSGAGACVAAVQLTDAFVAAATSPLCSGARRRR